MSWTTPAKLKAQVQKLWDRGLLLSSLIGGESVSPSPDAERARLQGVKRLFYRSARLDCPTLKWRQALPHCVAQRQPPHSGNQ